MLHSQWKARGIWAPALAIAAACCAAVQAAQPLSLNNLKGSYAGIYTSESGGANGKLTLKITRDVKNSRKLRGTLKFGDKSYKVTGAFTAATKQMNLAATSGHPPNVTVVSLTGFFNDSATQFNGGFTITSFSSNNHGTAQLTRGAH